MMKRGLELPHTHTPFPPPAPAGGQGEGYIGFILETWRIRAMSALGPIMAGWRLGGTRLLFRISPAPLMR